LKARLDALRAGGGAGALAGLEAAKAAAVAAEDYLEAKRLKAEIYALRAAGDAGDGAGEFIAVQCSLEQFRAAESRSEVL
jgi:hypothetical protein